MALGTNQFNGLSSAQDDGVFNVRFAEIASRIAEVQVITSGENQFKRPAGTRLLPNQNPAMNHRAIFGSPSGTFTGEPASAAWKAAKIGKRKPLIG